MKFYNPLPFDPRANKYRPVPWGWKREIDRAKLLSAEEKHLINLC